MIITRLSRVEICFQQRFSLDHPRDAILINICKPQMDGCNHSRRQVGLIQVGGDRTQSIEESGNLMSLPICSFKKHRNLIFPSH